VFGYSMAICGIVLVQTSFVKSFCVNVYGDQETCFQNEEENLPDSWVAFTTQFTGLFSLGSMFGAALSGPMSDQWGRKYSLALSASIFAIGTALNIGTLDLSLVLASRVIAGLGVGAASCIAPVYLAEISINEDRGVVMAMLPLVLTGGILTAASVGQYFINQENGWIYSLGIAIPAAAIMLFGALWCPESPRWLMGKDHYEAANSSLRRLRPSDQGSDIGIKAELMEMAAHSGANTGQVKLSDLFQSSITYRVFLACGIQILNQFCGIGVVMSYGPLMMNAFEAVNQNFGIMFLYAMGTAGTIGAAYFVDRWGRRALYVRGSYGMITGLLLSGGAARLFDLDEPDEKMEYMMGYIFVLGLGVFMFFYSISWGALAWVYPVEIFPLQIRAKAVSLSTLCYYFALYLTSYSLEVIHYLGLQTLFYTLAGVSVFALYFIYRFAPETKGVRLEDMDIIFDQYRSDPFAEQGNIMEHSPDKIQHPESVQLLSEALIS